MIAVVETVTLDAGQEVLGEFLQGELASVRELSFAFRRAASRLTDMLGQEYYQQWRDTWQVNHH